jgi:hypothetical protein
MCPVFQISLVVRRLLADCKKPEGQGKKEYRQKYSVSNYDFLFNIFFIYIK